MLSDSSSYMISVRRAIDNIEIEIVHNAHLFGLRAAAYVEHLRDRRKENSMG